jgi:hypothetical protein
MRTYLGCARIRKWVRTYVMPIYGGKFDSPSSHVQAEAFGCTTLAHPLFVSGRPHQPPDQTDQDTLPSPACKYN